MNNTKGTVKVLRVIGFVFLLCAINFAQAGEQTWGQWLSSTWDSWGKKLDAVLPAENQVEKSGIVSSDSPVVDVQPTAVKDLVSNVVPNVAPVVSTPQVTTGTNTAVKVVGVAAITAVVVYAGCKGYQAYKAHMRKFIPAQEQAEDSMCDEHCQAGR